MPKSSIFAFTMVISSSYEEISALVRERSGRNIGIRYKDVDTLTLSVEASIPIPILAKPLTHTLSTDVRLASLDLPRAVIEINAGKAGNFALDMASQKLLERLPAGLVESFEGGRATLNLEAIPKLRELLGKVKINGLSFYSTSLSLDVTML